MDLTRRSLRMLPASLALAGLTAGLTATLPATLPAAAAPVVHEVDRVRVDQTTQARPAVRLAASARTAKHPRAGVVYHALWGNHSDADRRAMFDRLQRMHIRWVRIGLPWALLQPRKPTPSDKGWSDWGLQRVDRVARMASKRGIQVSFTFLGTPGWANGGKGPKYLPDDPADYARALRRVAKRYRGKATSFEIYNEVSGGIHLKDATVEEYKQVLCAAYAAVNAKSPRAKVLSAGTGRDAVEWVRDLYRAGGGPCLDVLAIHPYYGDQSPLHPAGKVPGWMRKTREMRQIMRNHGDRKKRIWFTEFGWNTGPVSGGISPELQAKYLVQMFRVTDRRLPFVSRMSPYMAQDEDSSPTSDSLYGLYTYDMRPKPAVAALRTHLANR